MIEIVNTDVDTTYDVTLDVLLQPSESDEDDGANLISLVEPIAEVTENKPLMGVIITKNSDGSKTYTYSKVQERIFKPQHYLLPIPRDEINRTGLPQNPGYN